MIIALYVISWIVCAIIVAVLASKIEKEPIIDYAPALFLWPIGLIVLICEALVLICEALVMYIKYIRSEKEHVENLKQEKRSEVEDVLKEI